ncbi:MAG: hypothetical protein C0478_10810, partial [Planctomyces sp.]|nr:hypothetical protein [Planctomyces sp.]
GSPAATPEVIPADVVTRCWFEWQRQGGCGPGELECQLPFGSPLFQPGDFVSITDPTGTRWYLGRIEEHLARWPHRSIIKLEGLAVELGEIFPGGFVRNDSDAPTPYRLGITDGGFSHDPDFADESYAYASRPEEVVRQLLELDEITSTHITFPSDAIVETDLPVPIESLKFNGEESLRSIFKDLALRAQNAVWGVDPHGAFFFRAGVAPSTQSIPLASIIKLEQSRSLDQIFNRVLLTGAYLYQSNGQPYRWRGNYTEPTSRALYGERRIRLWVPWIRSSIDARSFLREFFARYAFPNGRISLECVAAETWLPPWEARYQLEGPSGLPTTPLQADTLRIEFDETPVYRLELGPVDPRILWPEPEHDERWPIAPTSDLPSGYGGEDIPAADPHLSSGGGGGGDTSSAVTEDSGSTPSDLFTSDLIDTSLSDSDLTTDHPFTTETGTPETGTSETGFPDTSETSPGTSNSGAGDTGETGTSDSDPADSHPTHSESSPSLEESTPTSSVSSESSAPTSSSWLNSDTWPPDSSTDTPPSSVTDSLPTSFPPSSDSPPTESPTSEPPESELPASEQP